jgi:hypothetical protein
MEKYDRRSFGRTLYEERIEVAEFAATRLDGHGGGRYHQAN